MRIVCLVPSITKTLCDLGLKTSISGITNFCVDPPGLYKTAKRIGGTKDPDLADITSIDPTHVIVNEEENRKSDIDFIRKNFNTLTTFPKSPEDVPHLLEMLGNFLSVEEEANRYSNEIVAKLQQLKSGRGLADQLGKRFLYLIWRDPWMAVSRDTYISAFLELMGLENCVSTTERYPVLDLAGYVFPSVDTILLASEPWPFRRRDAAIIREKLGPKCPKLYWIDGKAMSWYGTETLSALNKLEVSAFQSQLVKEI